jgi:glycosyltransferase involved in cell wall biosynthesis
VRLAFLTHEPFYPPSGGGSAEAVYLVRELTRRGHEVHLFCPWFPEADYEESLSQAATVPHAEKGKASSVSARRFSASTGDGRKSPGGLRFHLFATWQMNRYTSLRNVKYLAYPFFLERMVQRAATNNAFQIIVSQHAISAVAAGRLKRRLGLPVVMNFLDYLTGFMETWPRYLAPRSFIRALEKFELSLPLRYQADGVMTVSDTLADYFANAGYSRDRIRPIYYGYDSQLFRPAESSVAGDDSKSPVIVMHGSFDQHHLGTVAAIAVAYVTEKRPETRFRFVGKQTPALKKFCQKIGAAVPRARLECTGFVPYAEIAGQLANASVGIVPYEESTGTHCAFVAKIVECLGVGLPVVSTPLNSARRYFGNEPAVRFSEFNGESFGRQILTWLDEPLERRRAVGHAASRRVHVQLDWSAISKKAVDFLEEIQQQQGRI